MKPNEHLGQRFGVAEYRLLLQFYLGLPLFPSEAAGSPGEAHDVFGDHAVTCLHSGLWGCHNRLGDTNRDNSDCCGFSPRGRATRGIRSRHLGCWSVCVCVCVPVLLSPDFPWWALLDTHLILLFYTLCAGFSVWTATVKSKFSKEKIRSLNVDRPRASGAQGGSEYRHGGVLGGQGVLQEVMADIRAARGT